MGQADQTKLVTHAHDWKGGSGGPPRPLIPTRRIYVFIRSTWSSATRRKAIQDHHSAADEWIEGLISKSTVTVAAHDAVLPAAVPSAPDGTVTLQEAIDALQPANQPPDAADAGRPVTELRS